MSIIARKYFCLSLPAFYIVFVPSSTHMMLEMQPEYSMYCEKDWHLPVLARLQIPYQVPRWSQFCPLMQTVSSLVVACCHLQYKKNDYPTICNITFYKNLAILKSKHAKKIVQHQRCAMQYLNARLNRRCVLTRNSLGGIVFFSHNLLKEM